MRLVLAITLSLILLAATVAAAAFNAKDINTYTAENLKNPVNNLKAAFDAGKGQDALDRLGTAGVIDPAVRTTLLDAFAKDATLAQGPVALAFFEKPGTPSNFVGQGAVNYMKNRYPPLTINAPDTGIIKAFDGNTLTSSTGQTLPIGNLAADTKITINGDGTFSVCAPGKCREGQTGTKINQVSTPGSAYTTLKTVHTAADGTLTIEAGFLATQGPVSKTLIVGSGITSVETNPTYQSFRGVTATGDIFIAKPGGDSMTITTSNFVAADSTSWNTASATLAPNDFLSISRQGENVHSFQQPDKASVNSVVSFGTENNLPVIQAAGTSYTYSHVADIPITVTPNNIDPKQGLALIIGGTPDPKAKDTVYINGNTITQQGGTVKLSPSGKEEVTSTPSPTCSITFTADPARAIQATPTFDAKDEGRNKLTIGTTDFYLNKINVISSTATTAASTNPKATAVDLLYSATPTTLFKLTSSSLDEVLIDSSSPATTVQAIPGETTTTGTSSLTPTTFTTTPKTATTETSAQTTEPAAQRLATIDNAIADLKKKTWQDNSADIAMLETQRREVLALKSSSTQAATSPPSLVKPAPAQDEAARAQWDRLANAIRDETLRGGSKDDYQIEQWRREQADLARKYSLADLVPKNNAVAREAQLTQTRIAELTAAQKQTNAPSWIKNELKTLTKYLDKLNKKK